MEIMIMNKYKEAWNNVRSLAETSDYYKECDDKDIDLIASIVEKEIPKKPDYEGDGYVDYKWKDALMKYD